MRAFIFDQKGLVGGMAKVNLAEARRKEDTAMWITRYAPNLCIVVLLTILSGCAALGPTTINRDRFDYTE